MSNTINVCYVFAAATTSEVSARRHTNDNDSAAADAAPIRSETAVAILNKNANASGSCGTLACDLPWGRGWGWATLPNGVWIGGRFL